MGRKRKAGVLEDDSALVGGSNASLTSAPTLKRARKVVSGLTTETKTAAPEKRAARIRTTCPQNIQERVARVMSQRFFMIERERNPKELRETFKVLGSTGNVYTVRIDTLPSCDCPDALKGNHCKHILFVFLKVLGVRRASTYYFQKALLQTELAEIFSNAPAAPNSIANNYIISAYENATGKKVGTSQQSQPKEKRPVDGEDCPVCYETMSSDNLSLIAFCDICCNGLHKECFQQWAKKTPVTCVYCRSPWVGLETDAASAGSGSKMREGYLNMSDAVGISSIRDTSSYYHGPARNRKYRSYRRRNYYSSDDEGL